MPVYEMKSSLLNKISFVNGELTIEWITSHVDEIINIERNFPDYQFWDTGSLALFNAPFVGE